MGNPFLEYVPIGSFWAHHYRAPSSAVDTLWEVTDYEPSSGDFRIKLLAMCNRTTDCLEIGEVTTYPASALVYSHRKNWKRLNKEDVPIIVLGMLDE